MLARILIRTTQQRQVFSSVCGCIPQSGQVTVRYSVFRLIPSATTLPLNIRRHYSKSRHRRLKTPPEHEDDEGRKRKLLEEEEDYEEEKSDDDEEKRIHEELPTDYKTLEYMTLTRRLDLVVSKALHVTTAFISDAITQGMVRVNEKVVTKKATEIDAGDEVQLFEKAHEDNPKLASVKLLKIMRCRFDRTDGYKLKVYVWRSYITDNWMKTEPDV